MPRPQAPGALCAFADHLATRTGPRDPRGVRHALPVLLATRRVALAGGANGMAAVAAFTHDHQAWFRLWLPLGTATPSRDTYLRRVRRRDPETAMKAALWLLDGTSLPGLRELILALDGKVARRAGDPGAGTRALHRAGAFLVREGLTPTGSPVRPRATRSRPSPVGSTAGP
ncbi:MAG: transposase family protein [Caldilineaceae bacterium]|nr:transposase family protein [Caldilineaceae bacterium]